MTTAPATDEELQVAYGALPRMVRERVKFRAAIASPKWRALLELGVRLERRQQQRNAAVARRLGETPDL